MEDAIKVKALLSFANAHLPKEATVTSLDDFKQISKETLEPKEDKEDSSTLEETLVATCLEYLEAEGIPLFGIDVKQIVEGDHKAILSLLWTIARDEYIRQEDELPEEVGPSLLAWCSERLSSTTAHDFCEDFRDGHALVEMLNALKDKSIVDVFDTDVERVAAVLQMGNTMGIPALVDPADMVEHPFEDVMMLYIAGFRVVEKDEWDGSVESEEIALEQERRRADAAETRAHDEMQKALSAEARVREERERVLDAEIHSREQSAKALENERRVRELLVKEREANDRARDAKEHIVAWEAQAKEREERVKEGQVREEQAKEEAKKAREQVVVLETRCDEMEKQLRAQKQTEETMTSQLEQVRVQVAEGKVVEEGLQREVLNTKKQTEVALQQLEQRLATAQKERKDEQSACQKWKNECSIVSERVNHLEAAVSKTEQREQATLQRAQQQEQRALEVEQQVAAEKVELAKMEAILQQRDLHAQGLEEQLKQAKTNMHSLEEKVHIMEKSASAAEVWEEEKKILQQRVQTRQQNIRDLKTRLVKEHARAQSIQAQVAEWERRHGVVLLEKREVKSRLEQAVVSLQVIGDHAETEASYAEEKELSSTRNEIELGRLILVLESQVSTLEVDLQETLQRAETAEISLGAFRGEHQSVSEQLDGLQKQIQSLEIEVGKRDEKYRLLLAENKSLASQLEATQTSLDKLDTLHKADQEEYQKKIRRLELHLGKTRERLRALKEEHQQVATSLKTADERHGQELEEWKEKFKAMNEVYQAEKMQTTELQHQLDQQKTRSQTLRKEHDGVLKRNKEMEHELLERSIDGGDGPRIRAVKDKLRTQEHLLRKERKRREKAEKRLITKSLPEDVELMLSMETEMDGLRKKNAALESKLQELKGELRRTPLSNRRAPRTSTPRSASKI